tara:strand:- start:846 stop:1484 length:639 start_codon:yes stop_codon:yes gene_type:complete
MGRRSKPKAEDYKPSELEKAQAAIASEEQRYFEQTYQPLLEKQRDIAAKEKFAPTLKGRAQADTMQALTGQSNLALSQGLGQSGNIALGAIGNQLAANTDAANAAAENQLNVLGTATGQRMTAGDALANAARLKQSENLSKAQAKQTVRLARNQALFNMAKNVASMGAGNIASGSGSFFKRAIPTMQGGQAGTQNYGFFGMRKTKDPWEKSI